MICDLACRQDLAPSKTQSLTLGIIVSSSSAKPLISAPRSSWRLPTGRVFTQLQPHLEELQTIVSPAGLGAYASTASTDLHLHIISKFIHVRWRLEARTASKARIANLRRDNARLS